MRSPNKHRAGGCVCLLKALPSSSGMSHDFLFTIPLSAAQIWSQCCACSPSLTTTVLFNRCSNLSACFFFLLFFKVTYICKSVQPSEQKHQPGSQHRRQRRVKQCQGTTVKGKQWPYRRCTAPRLHIMTTDAHARACAHACVEYSSNLAAKHSTSPPQ